MRLASHVLCYTVHHVIHIYMYLYMYVIDRYSTIVIFKSISMQFLYYAVVSPSPLYLIELAP